MCKLLASKQLVVQTVLSRPRDVKYSKVVDALRRITSESGLRQGHSVLKMAETKVCPSLHIMQQVKATIQVLLVPVQVGVSLSEQQRQDVAHFEDTLATVPGIP